MADEQEIDLDALMARPAPTEVDLDQVMAAGPTATPTPQPTVGPDYWPAPAAPDPQMTPQGRSPQWLNDIGQGVSDALLSPLNALLAYGEASKAIDEDHSAGGAALRGMGPFGPAVKALGDNVIDPLKERIATGQLDPYEMGARTVAETGTGMLMHGASKALPGPAGWGVAAVAPMTVSAVGELVNYLWPSDDADEGHATVEHVDNFIRNSANLYTFGALGKILGATGGAIKGGAEDKITDMKDAAQKALAGDKPVFERKAAKQGITVLDLEGNEVKPGQKVDPHLLTYKTKLDDTAGVLEEKGYFENYTDPQNFLARLQHGKDTALARRQEILQGIDDDIVSKVENPVPRSAAPATPKIDADISLLQKEIGDLKIYDPTNKTQRALYESVKKRMLNRIDGTLTREGAEELLSRGANAPADLLERMFQGEPQVVGKGYTPVKSVRVPSGKEVTGYNFDPATFSSEPRLKQTFAKATSVQPYDIKASTVPTYQTPQVMNLEGLFKLKTEFQNKADRYFLQSGKSGDRAYNVAKAYAKGALAVEKTIQNVQKQYVEVGLLTKGQANELADINREVSAAITWEPMARGISAQTMPGATAATERVVGKGIRDRAYDYVRRSGNKWINNGGDRMIAGLENMGAGMQAAGAAVSNPAMGPLVQNQREINEPLQFPRDSRRFFSLSPEVIAQEFGPKVADDFVSNMGSAPEVQREFVYQLSSKDPELFQDPPSALQGYNVVDGIVAKDDVNRASNYLKSLLEKPDADPRIVAQLRKALHLQQPLTARPAPTATAEVEHITRTLNTGLGRRQDYSY